MTAVVNGILDIFIDIKVSENNSCTESCTRQIKHLNSQCYEMFTLFTVAEVK